MVQNCFLALQSAADRSHRKFSPCLSSILPARIAKQPLNYRVYQYQTKQNPVHNLQHRFHSAKDIVVQKPRGVCKILTETGAREKVGH